nr:hypothetical protein [Tanacetum cinerariifolium]GFC20182.1 hypothetical protein [Tanacetum cinerariifolium]
MIKAEFKGMMKKDIEDITTAEYIEYEAEMKRKSWRNARSYFPTKYEDMDINYFHHDKSRVLDYPRHSDDSKINAYYGLQSLLPCFKPVQPHTKDRMINHTDGNKPFTPKPQPGYEELSSDEDLDDWFKIEMKKHICRQDKENEEDALVAILKSLVGECKKVYTNKGAQIETSSDGTNEIQGVSFVVDDDIQNEEGVM